MRITSFRIENYRNIRLAACTNPPDFMVICGGNGCGKSALLNALMTAKEGTAAYGGYQIDNRAVSADAASARVSITLAFEQSERDFVSSTSTSKCPPTFEVVVEVSKDSGLSRVNRDGGVEHLLHHFSRTPGDRLGFFDYFDPYRRPTRAALRSWDASGIGDEATKQTLATVDMGKFQYTKQYLAGLSMRDLREIKASRRAGRCADPDSLKEIRDFFGSFFSPMRFVDVYLEESPFRFAVSTPRGDIDIDDLSSGEKEILYTYIRFHQLKPKGSIILFDEPEIHLHPDLQRRYLEALRALGQGNQLWLTTHSPEMMIAAGSDALYTLLKEPPCEGGNQLVRVTDNQQLHNVLANVMGSRGIVSFNKRIIFIEGEDASADREIYEKLYPPSIHNVSFVPATSSSMVQKTIERVQALLTGSTDFFQRYYGIVDGDAEPGSLNPSADIRLFRLPVCHVENFLLDEGRIYDVARRILREKCPFAQASDVRAKLEALLLDDGHLKPYARMLFDAQKAGWEKVVLEKARQKAPCGTWPDVPDYSQCAQQAKARLEAAMRDDTWHRICKGRDLLKTFCGAYGITYEHFRNLLIDEMTQPPPDLAAIMQRILSD